MLRNGAYFFTFTCAITVMSSILTEGAVVSNKEIYPKLNISRAGICTLEVPTLDLISPEDRASGAHPQGNGTRPGFSKIEICCSGWTRKPHSHYECEPVCDNGCENGNCTAPNVCSCKRGFIKDGNQNCIPTCPIGCLNGVCTHQGYCSCNSGHELSPDGRYCTAVCTGGCGIGGECVGGDTCRCRPGFSLNNGRCEYHCEGGCGGGVCIGPNKCSCKTGWKTSGNTCVPDCPRGCKDGSCTAPNVCTCQPGWTLDQTGAICQPHCREPCLNADCTAPDTCTCKRGYTQDPRSAGGNRCVASCPGGCENGVCSAPNFCICNPGFVKEVKGSNRCIRRLRRDTSSMHLELIPEQFDN